MKKVLICIRIVRQTFLYKKWTVLLFVKIGFFLQLKKKWKQRENTKKKFKQLLNCIDSKLQNISKFDRRYKLNQYKITTLQPSTEPK